MTQLCLREDEHAEGVKQRAHCWCVVLIGSPQLSFQFFTTRRTNQISISSVEYTSSCSSMGTVSTPSDFIAANRRNSSRGSYSGYHRCSYERTAKA
mmetsp:Transcript_3696/g.10180  ORF Transcript_3696/g.10180 Transcript_3696/m.10180 type:complete len:96 (+) Transcript_3696:1843-2130(+)